MKVYISADIEGITGIDHWDEATRWKPDYPPFREQMMKEVISACKGANEAGVDEIWIQDAHGSGRNLTFEGMPENVKLVRAFNGHPYCMMQSLDQSFDAAIMIGYHSYAGAPGNPLSHTLNTDLVYMKINGDFASEYMVNHFTAAYENVPVVFISGDEMLCQHAIEHNPSIKTVSTMEGVGSSVISRHPRIVEKEIAEGVKDALAGNLDPFKIKLPEYFEVELKFADHAKNYKASFYPGMVMKEDGSLKFSHHDYYEVLRMFAFVCM